MVLFLCGDVMLGRRIDQILPHPGAPSLHESYLRNALDYVRLAERGCGPIARPINFRFVWGDALAWMERMGMAAGISLPTTKESPDTRISAPGGLRRGGGLGGG